VAFNDEDMMWKMIILRNTSRADYKLASELTIQTGAEVTFVVFDDLW